MKSYVLSNDDGEIFAWGAVANDSDIPLGAILGSGNPETHYVLNGEIKEYSKEQAEEKMLRQPGHRWSNSEMRYIDQRSVNDMKSAKNEAIDEARLRANGSHFIFNGHRISVDAMSKSDIMGAHGEWLTGQAPENWPGGWKTMDKNPDGSAIYVAIPDQATWLQFYRAMVAQGTANFNHAQALKAQLAAATTPAEVEAVPDW